MNTVANASTVRPLFEIAKEIRKEWPKVNYAAVPYLNAMRELNSINDHYIMDSGEGIVRYFLCNAGTWRGDAAKRIKAELKQMVGIK